MEKSAKGWRLYPGGKNIRSAYETLTLPFMRRLRYPRHYFEERS